MTYKRFGIMTRTFFLFAIVISCSCQQNSSSFATGKGKQEIIIDSAFRDTVKKHIQLISNSHTSYFKTPMEYRFFANGRQEDSTIEKEFATDAWYGFHNDTLSIVAYIYEFETGALLIEVINNKPKVSFYRAPHLPGRLRFKLNKNDTFTDQLRIPPVRYKLRLSELPDSLRRQIIYGHIDMQSGSYYDSRDSLQEPLSVSMNFYFRAQYQDFNK